MLSGWLARVVSCPCYGFKSYDLLYSYISPLKIDKIDDSVLKYSLFRSVIAFGYNQKTEFWLHYLILRHYLDSASPSLASAWIPSHELFKYAFIVKFIFSLSKLVSVESSTLSKMSFTGGYKKIYLFY